MKQTISATVIASFLLFGVLFPLACSENVNHSDSTADQEEPTEKEQNQTENEQSQIDEEQNQTEQGQNQTTKEQDQTDQEQKQTDQKQNQSTQEQNQSNEEDNQTETAKNDDINLFDFSAKTVKNTTISTDDLKGKVVLVNYWGTWCPPCIKEIPHFVETFEEYKDEGFVILGIAAPRGDTGGKNDVISFMKKNEVTYPVIMFDDAPNAELQKRFGKVKAVPTSILIDRSGNHVDTFVGYTEKDTLVQKVKPLLNSGNNSE